jgi:hypothetical protein
VALRVGAAALWLPLSAVAFLDLAAVGLLAGRMTALTRRRSMPIWPRPVGLDGLSSPV